MKRRKHDVKTFFSERATQWVTFYADAEPRTIITQNLNSRQRFTLRSEEHTSELQSRGHPVCRLLLEKKKNTRPHTPYSMSSDAPPDYPRSSHPSSKHPTSAFRQPEAHSRPRSRGKLAPRGRLHAYQA